MHAGFVCVQIWTFLRTDVFHRKEQVLEFRTEDIPALKSSALQFIYKAVEDPNVGVRAERKDFLCETPGAERITKLHTRARLFQP